MERATHYAWELSLTFLSVLAASMAMIGIIWIGVSRFSVTDLLIVLSSVFLVLLVGVFYALSRQRAVVNRQGIAPESLALCRIRRNGMIPWTSIERVEVQKIGKEWRFHLYLKNRKWNKAHHQVFPPDFERPELVVRIVQANFKVDMPENRE